MEARGAKLYLTQSWIGRLRLHIFHRGDPDPDPHDHPWSFWTFPLTPYVEEVVKFDREHPYVITQTVPAFRLSFREAHHTHRVLGRSKGSTTCARGEDMLREGKIITLVWRARASRHWGFLKSRDGRWCWILARDYILGGGKEAPCASEAELNRDRGRESSIP